MRFMPVAVVSSALTTRTSSWQSAAMSFWTSSGEDRNVSNRQTFHAARRLPTLGVVSVAALVLQCLGANGDRPRAAPEVPMHPSKSSGLMATCLVASACSGVVVDPHGNGGQAGTSTGGTEAQCHSAADCAADEQCVFGTAACPPGAYCILPASGTCQPRMGQGGASQGGAPGIGGSLARGGTTSNGGSVGKGGASSFGCCSNADCAPGQTCSGAACCPVGAICILPSKAGVCQGPVQCATSADCPTGQTCVQVIFPIYPPQGFGGATTRPKLGECRSPSASVQFDSTSTSAHANASANARAFADGSDSSDSWWREAEAALAKS